MIFIGSASVDKIIGAEDWFQDVNITKPFLDSTHPTVLEDVPFAASGALMAHVKIITSIEFIR